VIYLPFAANAAHFCDCYGHRHSQGGKEVVILCFQRRYPKQSSVFSLKSNILPLPTFFFLPPNFCAGYATSYSNMHHFRCDVERVKRCVNVHLQWIVSKLKMVSKMSILPPPGKISADAHVHNWIIPNRLLNIFLKFQFFATWTKNKGGVPIYLCY